MNELEKLCKLMDVPIGAVLSNRRLPELVEVRQIFSYLMKEKGYSADGIGNIINRHRATVNYSWKFIKGLIEVSKDEREKIECIKRGL